MTRKTVKKQLSLNECLMSLDEYLEAKTWENIVLHIRKEALLRIMSGESAVAVIPEGNQRSKLKRDGVLVEKFYGGEGKRMIVSEKARQLLRSSMKDE